MNQRIRYAARRAFQVWRRGWWLADAAIMIALIMAVWWLAR